MFSNFACRTKLGISYIRTTPILGRLDSENSFSAKIDDIAPL